MSGKRQQLCRADEAGRGTLTDASSHPDITKRTDMLTLKNIRPILTTHLNPNNCRRHQRRRDQGDRRARGRRWKLVLLDDAVSAAAAPPGDVCALCLLP